MAKGANYSIYLNSEDNEALKRVVAHIGYGVSGSLVNLIQNKDNEIKEGLTRRQVLVRVEDRVVTLEEAVLELRQNMDSLTQGQQTMLEMMTELLSVLGRGGAE